MTYQELLVPVYGLLVGSSTHNNDGGNSNENNKTSNKFIKQYNNTLHEHRNRGRSQDHDFSNRFMNFRIQLLKHSLSFSFSNWKTIKA